MTLLKEPPLTGTLAASGVGGGTPMAVENRQSMSTLVTSSDVLPATVRWFVAPGCPSKWKVVVPCGVVIRVKVPCPGALALAAPADRPPAANTATRAQV